MRSEHILTQVCMLSVVSYTGNVVRQAERPPWPYVGPRTVGNGGGGQSLSPPFVCRGVHMLVRSPVVAPGARASGEYMSLQY